MTRPVRIRRRHREPGQSLVEFALVFPIFFTMFLGIVEFAFAFNALLAVNFASRNAALYAAEASTGSGADCVILNSIETDIGPPADARHVTKVEIYRANSDGTPYTPSELTRYTRTGSASCVNPDGTSTTVPYTKTLSGYPEVNRCNILAGCGGTHTTIDHIGVRIFYTHPYVTPLQSFVGMGTSLSFDRANVMRMEPIL
jgi:Flp pilus assembly protein TadG